MPNFSLNNIQVFLGQKYGYRPIPTYVLSSELQLIRDELAATGNDPTLLDTWYRKDSNAVPPVSVLQPISSILINFNNKVYVQKVGSALGQLKRRLLANPETASGGPGGLVGHFGQVPEAVPESFQFAASAGEDGQGRYAQLFHVRYEGRKFAIDYHTWAINC